MARRGRDPQEFPIPKDMTAGKESHHKKGPEIDYSESRNDSVNLLAADALDDGDAEVAPAGLWDGSCRGTPQRYLCLRCWKPQFSRLSGDLFYEMDSRSGLVEKVGVATNCRPSCRTTV